MKLEYINGVRITKLIHEMTPLEAAIQNYSNQAAIYHQHKALLANTLGETEKQRMDREADLKKEFKHLESQRRFSEAIIDVQVQVELYQAQNRKRPGETLDDARARMNRMKNEIHHPTQTLAKYMCAAGRPKPSPKHTSHHIAPGKGRTKAAYRARLHMHSLSIGSNDPDNGIWLIRLKADKGHWSMPHAQSHLEIHTNNYESWVARHITSATDESTGRVKLRHIRNLLQSGKQPKEVTMPPDENWKGL